MILPNDPTIITIGKEPEQYIASNNTQELNPFSTPLVLIAGVIQNIPYFDLRSEEFGKRSKLPETGLAGNYVNLWIGGVLSLAENTAQEEVIRFWKSNQRGELGINRVYAACNILCNIGVCKPFSIFELPRYGDFGTMVNAPCITKQSLGFLFKVFGCSVEQIPNKPKVGTYWLKPEYLQNYENK